MRGPRGIVAAVATATLATSSSHEGTRIIIHKSAEHSFTDNRGAPMQRGRHNHSLPMATITARVRRQKKQQQQQGERGSISSPQLVSPADGQQCPRELLLVREEEQKLANQPSTSSSSNDGSTNLSSSLLTRTSISVARRSLHSCPQRTTARRKQQQQHGALSLGSRVAPGRARALQQQHQRQAVSSSCALLVRGGGGDGGGGGTGRWFAGGGGDLYDEFPDDFDYDIADTEDDIDDNVDDSLCWAGEDGEVGSDDTEWEREAPCRKEEPVKCGSSKRGTGWRTRSSTGGRHSPREEGEGRERQLGLPSASGDGVSNGLDSSSRCVSRSVVQCCILLIWDAPLAPISPVEEVCRPPFFWQGFVKAMCLTCRHSCCSKDLQTVLSFWAGFVS